MKPSEIKFVSTSAQIFESKFTKPCAKYALVDLLTFTATSNDDSLESIDILSLIAFFKRSDLEVSLGLKLQGLLELLETGHVRKLGTGSLTITPKLSYILEEFWTPAKVPHAAAAYP
jgi:hypothetical protein